MFESLGRLKADDGGNGAGRDCGRLAAALGRAGWNSELFPNLPNAVWLRALICAGKNDKAHRT